MKKLRIMLAALLVALALGGCSQPFGSELARNSNRPTETAQPALEPEAQGEGQTSVSLYFQYGSEPYLSSETRLITVANANSLEQEMVRALITGPSAASPQLKRVINPNTRVLSVTEQGGCYYVTLSADFLEPILGLPEGWSQDASWRQLVQSTQQLAAYSLVNTLLGLGRAQSVQILIADSDGAPARRPTRGELGFLGQDRDAQLMEPMTLDLNRILTPEQAARLILRAMADQNWTRVERFIATFAPEGTSGRPARQALIDELAELDVTLLEGTVQGASVAAGGQSAVVLLDVTLQDKGASASRTLTGLPLSFVWENNGWLLSYASLEMLVKEGDR